MNKIFQPKRFGAYLLYDLRSAWNNYGITMLILGTLPLLVFVLNTLTELLLQGKTFQVDTSYAALLFGLALFILVVSFSAKTYGGITDKRYGSSWLLLPASTFEKFLSMLIVTCVVAPLCLCVLFGVTDTLMSLVFPNAYGPNIINNYDLQAAIDESIGVHINFPALLYVSFAVPMLAFTLGAVLFKKAKPAKTFLVILAFGFVLSIIAVAFASSGILDSNNMERYLDSLTEDQMQRMINTWLNVPNLILSVLLMCGLYFRLKTIKH